jgi:hypothetical protein
MKSLENIDFSSSNHHAHIQNESMLKIPPVKEIVIT